MNYLAHIYLSGNNTCISIGNFMADSIKGKDYQNYEREFKIGILLHREIDTFTDAHPIVRQSTKRLHPFFSHYSGVVVDVIYDHFLAKNWSQYADINLGEFANRFYRQIIQHESVLPARILKMLPYMTNENWLVSYSNMDGLSRIFTAMNSRLKHDVHMDQAPKHLQTFYSEFENDFTLFFEDLKTFSAEKLAQLEAQYPE